MVDGGHRSGKPRITVAIPAWPARWTCS